MKHVGQVVVTYCQKITFGYCFLSTRLLSHQLACGLPGIPLEPQCICINSLSELTSFNFFDSAFTVSVPLHPQLLKSYFLLKQSSGLVRRPRPLQFYYLRI